MSLGVFYGKYIPAMHTHLHLNVQDASPPLGEDIPDGSEGGAIAAASKGRMLNERVIVHELLEDLRSDEVVFNTILLAGPGGTGGILSP
jgi:hypothetical protein